MKKTTVALVIICMTLYLWRRTRAAWDSSFYVHARTTLADAKEAYDFETWGGSTKTTYVHTVTNWIVDLEVDEVSNVSQCGNQTWSQSNDMGRLREYVFEHTSTPTNFPYPWSLMTIEVPSVSNAHEMMVARFTQSSVGGIVDGTNASVEVGDKCFIRTAKPNWKQHIYFCRNNVFVQLTAWATNGYDGCADLATEIDDQILEASVGN